ncbi:MAG: efflux RND transporter periplasmic adaptor subunit [Bacteroidota bacterium]
MNKKVIWISVSLIVVIAVLITLKKTGVIGKDTSTRVAVEKAALRTIIETVSASGKLYPEDERKVSSDVSGEVVEMYVEEGDSVRRGQVLARVFADVLSSARDRAASIVNQQEAQVQNTSAGIDAFEARFSLARQNYERQKKLLNEKVISRAEFEQAESQFLAAQADLKAAKQAVKSTQASAQGARASLTEANKNLSRTTIISPMDGIVSLLAVKKGERVAGNSFSLGTEILRVADMSKIEVRVDVGENDIPKVKIGDSAIVEVDAYNERRFKGVVTKISSSSTSAQTMAVAGTTDVTNYKVYIRLDPASYQDLFASNSAGKLPFRPGMSASADIMTRKQENVLSVPVLALTTRDKNEKAPNEKDKEEKAKEDTEVNLEQMEEVLFVVENGKVKKMTVKTGIQDNDYIEIVSGIKAGAEVVSAPYNTISKLLKEGMEVEVVSKEKIYSKD